MHLKETLRPIIHLNQQADGSADTAQFAQDVAAGLNKKQKTLSSRYFYDGTGSRLFQDIMALPEYYLTRCEYDVLSEQQEQIARKFGEGGFFHLIDLGAGDALKTKIVLRALNSQQQEFDYVPVDISDDAMLQLTHNLQAELPRVAVQAVVGEYFKALEWLQAHKQERKVVLFLGSNIGNFNHDESMAFLKAIRSYLQAGDKLLVGLDLRKDPDTILQAYNDASGVTAAFNLNLLERINRELGGNFVVANFRHFATYNPLEGVMRSFLVSKIEQEVKIAATGKSFRFGAWEAIHTESSYKYTLEQAQEMGSACGFRTETVFQDEHGCFADVLFVVD